MNYYIAAGYTFKQLHNKARCILDALGHEITFDWTLKENATNYSNGIDSLREVGEKEMQGIRDAGFVVVLLQGAGRGTHVELGIALGMGKHVVIWSDTPSEFRANPSTCPFYFTKPNEGAARSISTYVYGSIESIVMPIVTLIEPKGYRRDTSPIAFDWQERVGKVGSMEDTEILEVDANV